MFSRKFAGAVSLVVLGSINCAVNHTDSATSLAEKTPNNPAADKTPNVPNPVISRDYAQKVIEDTASSRILEFTPKIEVSSVTVTYKVDSSGVTKTDEPMTKVGSSYRTPSIPLNTFGDNFTYSFKYAKSGGGTVTSKKYVDTYYANYTRFSAKSFTEDFDGEAITPNWTAELGTSSTAGELQSFVSNSISLKNQQLVIQAMSPTPTTYTSGRINSKNAFSFQYGRIDVSAKLPVIPGASPGILLVSTDSTAVWPNSGLISVMNLGSVKPTNTNSTNSINGVLEYPNGSIANYLSGYNSFFPALTSASDFHTYSVIWKENSKEIGWQVDGGVQALNGGSQPYGNNYLTKKNTDLAPGGIWPYNNAGNKFFIVLYLAVGGTWTGSGSSYTFPSTPDSSSQMLVDFVHVYSPLTPQ